MDSNYTTIFFVKLRSSDDLELRSPSSRKKSAPMCHLYRSTRPSVLFQNESASSSPCCMRVSPTFRPRMKSNTARIICASCCGTMIVVFLSLSDVMACTQFPPLGHPSFSRHWHFTPIKDFGQTFTYTLTPYVLDFNYPF